MTEKEILTALKQGDQSALETLYDQYGSVLYGVILRIVQSEVLADEVMQETFLKIWRSAGSFDESKGGLFSRSLNLARSTALETIQDKDYQRNQKMEPFDFLSYQEAHPPVNLASEKLSLKELSNRLEDRLLRVVDMAFFMGASKEEIEKEVNIPAGTVRNRLRMAMRRIN